MSHRLIIALVSLIAVATASGADSRQLFEDRFFTSKDTRLRYVDVGTGPPVVLLHGFATSVERAWLDRGVIQGLSRDHRVIALDCRGHGKSDKPHEMGRYGMEMVEDVARLLDHLKIAKAHLVGYSMGGLIAGKFTATHPDRVLTAIFGGVGPGPSFPFKEQQEQIALDLENGRGSPILAMALFPPDGPKPSQEQIDTYSNALVANNDALALAAAFRSMNSFDVTAREIAALRPPMLAIVGSQDQLKPSVDALKQMRPDVKVVVIAGATHGPPDSAAARPEFVAAIRDFIAAANVPGSSR